MVGLDDAGLGENSNGRATSRTRASTDSQTPRVFPAAPIGWTVGDEPYNHDPLTWYTVLPVKNGGPGVALNVWAKLDWPEPDSTSLATIQTSLAPGASADLRIDTVGTPPTNWRDVVGSLIYQGIDNATWRTSFHIDLVQDDRRSVFVGQTIRLSPPEGEAREIRAKEGRFRSLLRRRH